MCFLYQSFYPKYVKHTPTSGPLYLLFLPFEMFSPEIFAQPFFLNLYLLLDVTDAEKNLTQSEIAPV